MSKTGNKGNKRSKTNTFIDLKRFRKSLKVVQPNDPKFCNLWVSAEDFGIDLSAKKSNSLETNSKSTESETICGQSKSKRKTKSSAKPSPKKSKPIAKRLSRFVTHLTETNDTNEENALNEDLNDETPVLMDISSPLKASSPLLISSSLNSTQNEPKMESKESVHRLLQKSFFGYFDEAIDKMRKSLNALKGNEEMDLRTNAMNVLKGMKQSRLAFSQRESLQTKQQKTLVLKSTKIVTVFSISYIYSVVMTDESNEFTENQEIIFIINHKIIEPLDLSSRYIIKVFGRWTQTTIDSQVIISNAFNVEFFETNEPNVDHRSEANDYTIIWQKDRP